MARLDDATGGGRTVVARLFGGLFLLLMLAMPTTAQSPRQRPDRADGTEQPYGPARLISGYPGLVSRITDNAVILANGTALPRRIGPAAPTEAERQARPDIDAMFVDHYPAGAPMTSVPTTDPGRVRYEPLFDAIYGDCRTGGVRLQDVAWMPGRGGGMVRVTSTNHVAEKLRAVVRDLAALPADMTRYLVPSAGGYHCRMIAGTNQRSMHGYGIAIDLASATADYWHWAGGERARYRNRVPAAIVAAFERHGFIWGGRWRHFDTMHFEYRPELLPVEARNGGW